MLDIEAKQRAAVVAAARSWIGTPYHNCADLKGIGIDCGMLLVRTFVDAGLVSPFDPRPYPPDWHLHRSEERYLSFLSKRLHEVPRAKLGAGDVAIFRYGRCYSHGGIITQGKPLTIVHAFARARCVTEEEVARNAELAEEKRAPRFFSYWATPDSERASGLQQGVHARERATAGASARAET